MPTLTHLTIASLLVHDGDKHDSVVSLFSLPCIFYAHTIALTYELCIADSHAEKRGRNSGSAEVRHYCLDHRDAANAIIRARCTKGLMQIMIMQGK